MGLVHERVRFFIRKMFAKFCTIPSAFSSTRVIFSLGKIVWIFFSKFQFFPNLGSLERSRFARHFSLLECRNLIRVSLLKSSFFCRFTEFV